MICISPLDFVKPGESRSYVTVPCGQCIPCRLRRKRDWALRMKHESEFHDDISFVTLTYDYCKRDPVLEKSDMQNFLKRLRINWKRCVDDRRIRFFGAGEYGSITARPHYHLILFGVGVDHVSVVEKSWKFGYIKSLPVKDGGCEYVAKYCVKTDGRNYPEGWQLPFALFSQGLGRDWMRKYAHVLADPSYQYFGQVLHNGVHVSMPRYYQRKLLDEDLKLQYRNKYATMSVSDYLTNTGLHGKGHPKDYQLFQEVKAFEEQTLVVSAVQAQLYKAKSNLIGGKI